MSDNNNNNKIQIGKKIGLPPMLAKIQASKQASAKEQSSAIELPNRIGLLLDVSGSMGGKSIEDLRLAYDSFVAALNFSDTALSIAHFGYSDDAAQDVPLTTDKTRIMLVGMGLHASGGTPMAAAMARVIGSQPITRAVLISDGGPTDLGWEDQAKVFTEAGVPCDCVHIAESRNGEAVLQKIAEITGGIYMKFKDTGNFAKAFKFLTPGGRLMLSGGDAKELTGADDVRI